MKKKRCIADRPSGSGLETFKARGEKMKE